MTVYETGVRSAAADLFERGLGYKAVARQLGIPPNTVGKWQDTFRSVGREALLTMGCKRSYDWETKVAAASAVVDSGKPKPSVMREFGIASRSPLDAWCRKYREGGAEALRPRPKGRPRGSGPKSRERTREQELEERCRRLEAEVAYLKKLRALVERDGL